MTTAIVLQARMGSTRLPGKVLALLGGRTVLAHCIERLRAHSQLPVIVATTTQAEDDLVEREATRLGAGVFRGAGDDVLGRFAMVVRTYGLDELIRATADNPAVDLDAPDRTLAILRRTSADHIVERGLPYGTCVEAISAKALLLADEMATASGDREHVTPWLRRERNANAFEAIAPGHLRAPKLRLTVDTPEDLDFVRRVFAAVDVADVVPDDAPLDAIIAAAARLEPATRGRSGTESR